MYGGGGEVEQVVVEQHGGNPPMDANLSEGAGAWWSRYRFSTFPGASHCSYAGGGGGGGPTGGSGGCGGAGGGGGGSWAKVQMEQQEQQILVVVVVVVEYCFLQSWWSRWFRNSYSKRIR